jgi:sialate O-acetylesterase
MKRITFILFAFFIMGLVQAQLKLAGIFGNNAVIQQGIAAPMWGQAVPGSTVEVTLCGQESKTLADEKGNWMIRMIPLKADGKSYELVVKSEDQKIVCENIRIGEVWFASGQSNM